MEQRGNSAPLNSSFHICVGENEEMEWLLSQKIGKSYFNQWCEDVFGLFENVNMDYFELLNAVEEQEERELGRTRN